MGEDVKTLAREQVFSLKVIQIILIPISILRLGNRVQDGVEWSSFGIKARKLVYRNCSQDWRGCMDPGTCAENKGVANRTIRC